AMDNGTDEAAAEEADPEDETAAEDAAAGADEAEESLSDPADDPEANEYDAAPNAIPSNYLRPGSGNPAFTKVDGTYKEGTFGYGVNSQIYTYSANGKDYRVLYIWSDSDNAKLSQSAADVYPTETTAITDIILNDNISAFSVAYMFVGFTNVTWIRLSNHLKELAGNDFLNCYSLKEITIPASLEEAYGDTFNGCSSLQTITFADGIEIIPEKFMGTTVELHGCTVQTVNLPSSVKIIGQQAFRNMENLTTVNFLNPDKTTLAYIGPLAFFRTNLSGIALPKFADWKHNGETVRSEIGSLVFGNILNPDFRTLIIPEGVKSLDQIYNINNKFQYIYLPSTLVNSGMHYGLHYAFSGGDIDSLKNIYFPGNQKKFEQLYGGELKYPAMSLEWPEKIVYGVKAPGPVVAVSVPAEQSSILRYYEEMEGTQQVYMYLTVDPATHEPTVFSASSTDESVATAVAANGAVEVTVKKKVGSAKITVTGGAASTEINVTVKHQDRAYKPVVRGSGTAYGDERSLTGATPNAQIFYLINHGTSASKLSDPATYTYDSATRRYTATYGKEFTDPLHVGIDFTSSNHVLHAVAVKKGFQISEELIMSMPYTPQAPYGDLTINDQDAFETADDVPEGVWIPQSQLNDPSIVYTGSAIKLTGLRVYFGKKLLTEKKDYNLGFKNNTNVATGTIKPTVDVKLTGDYAGTKSFEFTIYPKELKANDITYTPVNLQVKKSGADYVAQKPDLKVKLGTKQLKAGVDYTVKFKGTNPLYEETVAEPDTYTAQIWFSGNYANDGTALLSNAVNVADTEEICMDKVTVKAIPAQQITAKGQVIEPEFEVKYKGKVLPAEQYAASYTNNTAAGTGCLVLRGYGYPAPANENDWKFYGIKTVTFKINGIKLTKQNLTANLATNYAYTGAPIDPTAAAGFKLTYNGTDLIKGEDYKVSFKNSNVAAGKVNMIVEGTGIYEGSVTFTFTIDKTAMTDGCIEVKDTEGFLWNEAGVSLPYVQNGVTPAVKVLDTRTGKFLTASDFTVKYTNNKSAAVYNEMKGTKNIGPCFTITGKGNYSGSVTKRFSITATPIDSLTMEMEDMVYADAANKYTRKVTIRDTNGVALKARTDYEADLKYTYDEDVIVKRKVKSGKVTLVRSYMFGKNDPVSKEDIIPAGAVIRVTAKGVKNYTGDLSETFTVAARGVKDLKFTLTPAAYDYTGSPIRPGKASIKVQIKEGRTWKDVDDTTARSYYDVIGYSNNIKKGTAKITVKGKNGFAGNATVTFKINAKR
ncbi:MAG: leucine-rich repeat protein, partial [Lachnospiraceae bacterium]|nr:leucine-rich repeat protein [Lachnospiraceae bacterium]